MTAHMSLHSRAHIATCVSARPHDRDKVDAVHVPMHKCINHTPVHVPIAMFDVIRICMRPIITIGIEASLVCYLGCNSQPAVLALTLTTQLAIQASLRTLTTEALSSVCAKVCLLMDALLDTTGMLPGHVRCLRDIHEIFAIQMEVVCVCSI